MATIILITIILMIATIEKIDANIVAKRTVPSPTDDLQAAVALNNVGDRQMIKMQAQIEFPWEALLISASISINLLGQLVVISATLDVPLHLHTNLPYKRLRHSNFRPTLVQVSNEGWAAFNEANANMDSIRLHMAMIPTNVRSVLRIMSSSGTPVQIARYVRIPLGTIENSATQCVSLAMSTYDKFLDVQTLLLEVSEATEDSVRSSNLPAASSRNERFKATMAQQQLNKMQESYAKMFDKLMEENDKLQRLMVRLATTEIETTNFTQILELPIPIPTSNSEAIRAISRIREKWGELVMFFQRVVAVASVVVNGQVTTFLNLTRTSVANQDAKYLMENFQDEISETSIKTARAANFLLSVSTAYLNVSQSHLMGRLASLTALLTVKTPNERSIKMHELEQQSRASQSAIKEVCRLHKVQFEDQIEQEKLRIDQIFDKVGRPTPPNEEDIVRGNQLLDVYDV